MVFSIYQISIGILFLYFEFGIQLLVSAIVLIIFNSIKFIIPKDLKSLMIYIGLILILLFNYLGCFEERPSDLRQILFECPDFFIMMLAIYFILFFGLLVLSIWGIRGDELTSIYTSLLFLYATSPLLRTSESEILLALIEIYVIYKTILKNRGNGLFYLALIFIVINTFNNMAVILLDEPPKYQAVISLAEYLAIEAITVRYLIIRFW